METFQKTINETGLLVHAQTNTNYLTLLGADTDTKNPNGGLWSRLYTKINCNVLKTNDTDANTTIVVGHCPTNHSTRFTTFSSLITDIKDQHNYIGCDTDASHAVKGCVVADCFNNSIPKLIFVDTAMSVAFNKVSKTNINNIEYAKRNIEFLLLEHKETKSTARWIDTISRKPVGKGKDAIQLFPVKLK